MTPIFCKSASVNLDPDSPEDEPPPMFPVVAHPTKATITNKTKTKFFTASPPNKEVLTKQSALKLIGTPIPLKASTNPVSGEIFLVDKPL